MVGTVPGATLAVVLGVVMLGVAVWRPRLGTVAALLGTVALHGLLLTHHVDDAGIVYAYADNLAAGRGLVPQPGAVAVEGVSDPLWLALLASARTLGVVPTLASKLLQLGLGLVAVLGAGAVARRAGADDAGVGLSVALVATSGAWVAWSTAGLEGALFGALLVVTAWAAAAWPGAWLVVLVALCAWTRPEGAVAGVAAAAAGAALVGRPRRIGWALLGGGLGLGLLLGVRLAWLGTWLPNTAAAKLSPGPWAAARGAAYAALAVAQVGWVFLAAAAAPRLGGRGWVPAGLIVGTAIGLAVAMGGDWMRHARFLAPYVPVVVGLLVPAALAAWRAGGLPRGLAGLGLGGAASTGLIVLASAAWAPTVPLDHGLRRGQLYEALSSRCGRAVATADIGGVVYAWPEVRVVDLAGLVDPVAARRGREPGFWADRLRVAPASVVDLHAGWADRTGLDDATLEALGYRRLCRRGPGPEAPTLWLDAACPDPAGEARALLDTWCERGSGVPWPGEERPLFP